MSWAQESRSVLRGILRTPAIHAVLVLTLALGIAINGIYFAALYGSEIRPLPFERPDELVMLHQSRPEAGEGRLGVSAPNLLDWVAGVSVFEAVGAFVDTSYNVGRDAPERLVGSRITGSLFPVLGMEPALGRTFTEADERPGQDNVVLLSDALWQRQFNRDPAVVGRTLLIDDQVHEVVGVMPAGFRFPAFGDLWTPLWLDPDGDRTANPLGVVGRLQGGESVESAQRAIDPVAEDLAATHPATNRGVGVEVYSLREAWMPTGGLGPAVLVSQLTLFLGLLLVISTNIAQVVLARARARRNEFAIRAAMGAGRMDLVRIVAAESTVLAILGGALGTLLAWRSDLVLGALLPIPLPYWLDFSLPSVGLWYLIAVSGLSALFIAWMPALRLLRTKKLAALTARRSHASGRPGRARYALLVAQTSVVVLVLFLGILMVRSFQNLQRTDRGFSTEDVLTLQLPLDAPRFDEDRARPLFVRDLISDLQALPGVTAVGVSSSLPYLPLPSTPTLALQAETPRPDEQELRAAHHFVSADYFDALSIPLLEGRGFTEQEVLEGDRVAIVSASVARALWEDAIPIDRLLDVENHSDGADVRIVGVVGDIQPGQMIPGFGSMPTHRIYLPMAGVRPEQETAEAMLVPTVVIRSQRPPAALADDVRGTVRALAPTLPILEMRSMDQVLAQFYFAQQLWNRVFGAMALVTLLIAGIGVYGLTRDAVFRRRREFGIRLATGATPANVLRLVLREGLMRAAVGIGIGLAFAVPMGLAIEATLHEVSGLDPAVITLVAVIILVVSTAAALGPASRAASSDLVRSLRSM